MTPVEARVHDLLIVQRRSSIEVATELGITPSEVARIAARRPWESGPPALEPQSEQPARPDPGDRLTRQVRQALLVRTAPGAADEFPAAALVRLWQLLEARDQAASGADQDWEAVLEQLPATALEQFFQALDQSSVTPTTDTRTSA